MVAVAIDKGTSDMATTMEASHTMVRLMEPFVIGNAWVRRSFSLLPLQRPKSLMTLLSVDRKIGSRYR